MRQTAQYRFVRTKQTRTLPELERHAHGSVVRIQEGDQRLVRRIERDGPLRDGVFVRETRTLTVEGSIPAVMRPPRRRGRDALNMDSTKRLGAFLHRDRIHVRFFAPRARDVFLVLEDGSRYRMTPDRVGVWSTVVERNPSELYRTSYHFDVDGQRTADPLGVSYHHGSDTSRFVDPDFNWTDEAFRTPAPEDLVISEEHVRDATAHSSAPASDQDRGTYRGWAHQELLAHRRRVGVNAVEALPLHEYGPEARHWGFMPVQFFAPATRYASNPTLAPLELRDAVNQMHNEGIAVIADVVFNHTANDGVVGFPTIGPEFFYRMQDGAYMNGAGTGNEFDTERPMARRIVLQTLRHWREFFHIDGFRFDAGNLHSPGTLAAVERALPRNTILIAEPFCKVPERGQWNEGDLGESRFALWNIGYRDSVVAFVLGHGDRARVQTAVAGSVRPFGFATRPGQSINYLTSHDEHSLADMLQADTRRSVLAATILLTSQGIPMLEHGQEFLRSKDGYANSHDQDNEINWINWDRPRQHAEVRSVYEGLIRLRQTYPHFRYRESLTDHDITWLTPSNPNALGWLLHAPRDVRNAGDQSEFLILTNSDSSHGVSFQLPDGDAWMKLMDGANIDLERGLGTARNDYWVAPGTAVILARGI